jgi:hypothetical protein
MSKRYTKIDEIPYSRASKAGHLIDPDSNPLHGAYERPVGDGLVRRVAINNGTRVYGYDYVYLRVAPVLPVTRHNDANLILCGGYGWIGPGQRSADGYPPLLNYDDMLIQRVIAGAKPVAESYSWSLAVVEEWENQARTSGLLAWSGPGYHAESKRVRVAPAGRLVSDEEIDAAQVEYAQLWPGFEFDTSLVEELKSLTGERFVAEGFDDHTQGGNPVVLGLLLGYPPATTAARF